MKTYKWFFLVLISSILVACPGTSEEELIGDWQRRAEIDGSARSFVATFVIDNKGYVCCGFDGLKQRRNDAYEFDYQGGSGKGSWEKMSNFPGERRSHAVGFTVNRLGYVGTGWDGDETDMKDFWQFDPTKGEVVNGVLRGEWKQVAPMPEDADPRRGAIAFSLSVGGKEYGYVGFGFHEGTNERLYLRDIWQFDPDGETIDNNGVSLPGSWTKVTDYGGAKREGAAVFVIDNKAYICNGKNSTSDANDFWVFDPNAADKMDMWKSDPPRPMYNSNPDEDYDDDYGGLARTYGVAYVVSVGGQLRGHIVGGSKSSNWEYDHEKDLWIQRTQFYNHLNSRAREGMISFSFPSGRAFVGMGRSGSTNYDDMWEFIPLEDDYTYNDY